MSSSKKFDLERVFSAGICLSEAKNHIPSPPPPPHYTLYTYIQDTYSARGEGGRVEPERRGEWERGRVQITKLG
jgi:hypothetical protein